MSGRAQSGHYVALQAASMQRWVPDVAGFVTVFRFRYRFIVVISAIIPRPSPLHSLLFPACFSSFKRQSLPIANLSLLNIAMDIPKNLRQSALKKR